MKKIIIKIIITLAAIIIVSAGFRLYKQNFNNQDISRACTQEAKLCPDGSAVGRTGPNCEFAACPEAGTQSAAVIKNLLIKKYPKYASTLAVTVNQETPSHARGSVSFVPGQPGGYFLAAKIDNEWQIVFDGNGQIPCNLSKYGFPSDMLGDCS